MLPSRKSPPGGGFSLVEVLVALTLIGVALLAMTALYAGHHRIQVRAGEQMAAHAYLLDNMERLRSMVPLREGRKVWNLESKEEIPAPPGIPAKGGRLVLDTEPWKGAEDREKLFHVVLTLHWFSGGDRRSARLETLMRGTAKEGEGA